MKLLMAVVVALVLAWSAFATPDGFRESIRLSTIASGVAGRPVTVWCAVTEAAWLEALWGAASPPGANQEQHPSMAGRAGVPDNDSTQLAPLICRTLERWLRGKSTPTIDNLGPAILTLVHESIHLRGVRDEGQAECTALREMVPVAQQSFGIRKRETMRVLMQGAWAEHNFLPPKYRAC